MITTIVGRQIQGKGRAKILGFPTINLAITRAFVLPEGVYGVWATINKKTFLGALHYGPVPTFHEKEKSLEVFLINAGKIKLKRQLTCQVIIEVIEKIRDIKTFSSADELTVQISHDINTIRERVNLPLLF